MKAALPATIALFVSVCPNETLAGRQEDIRAAGMQLAIAANCRASYGDHELFEVAFAKFERLALDSEADITAEELAEAKQKLYETEAETGDNPFMRGFCNELKERLLPPE